jgi:Pyridoxamine 5'-phosphate oxidase
MSDVKDIVHRFQSVMSGPSDETIAALGEVLADDIRVVGMLGAGTDKATVMQGLDNKMAAALFGAAEWAAPDIDGDTVTLNAKLPVGAPLAGMLFELTVDESGKITQVLEEMTPAPPPAPTPLKLTDEIKDQIKGAFNPENASAVIVAYVDDQGVPHMSLRGTTQAFSDDQLAVWNRDRNSGMNKAITSNPNVSAFFRSATNGMIYQFAGRAHVDESANDAVYASSPEAERNADPRKKGVAIIIDLDRVDGLGLAGRFAMERGA